MARVLILAETRLVRDGIGRWLGCFGHEVVDTTGRAADALLLNRQHRPDVIVVELALTQGVSAVQAIVRSDPDARVVALRVPESDEAVIAYTSAGIMSYLSQEAPLQDLLPLVEGAAHGEANVPAEIALKVLRQRVSELREGLSPSETPLTYREAQVADLLARGLSDKEIASTLRIALTTVKTHVQHVLHKLGIRRRSQVAGALSRSDRGDGDNDVTP